MGLPDGARIGTQATDWSCSWCTDEKLFMRLSSATLVLTMGSPLAMTFSAMDRENSACRSSPTLERELCTVAPPSLSRKIT